MKATAVSFVNPVSLIGGGTLDRTMLADARALAPVLVAADGAADRLRELGETPELIIGDMDSLRDPLAWAGTRMLRLDEQDTTDFEKCLYATSAPLYIAAGFTGGRLDHTLAVCHGLLRWPEKSVVLLGEREVVVALPAGRPLSVPVQPGAVVSLFPLKAAGGIASDGLRWPVDGLALEPGVQIGTSNEATGDSITVGVDRPGVLLMLERSYLASLAHALGTMAT